MNSSRDIRVESIAAKASFNVDFSSLRHELNILAKSSDKLDKEKKEAEEDLRKVVKKIVRQRIIRRKLRKAWCKFRKTIGKPCHDKKLEWGERNAPSFTTHGGKLVRPRIGRFPVWVEEQNAKEQERQEKGHGCHMNGNKKGHEKLRKAIKRVQKVNKKLVAFEKGLISEDGIKDREWYKHLGVAPGKWLGKYSLLIPPPSEAAC